MKLYELKDEQREKVIDRFYDELVNLITKEGKIKLKEVLFGKNGSLDLDSPYEDDVSIQYTITIRNGEINKLLLP